MTIHKNTSTEVQDQHNELHEIEVHDQYVQERAAIYCDIVDGFADSGEFRQKQVARSLCYGIWKILANDDDFSIAGNLDAAMVQLEQLEQNEDGSPNQQDNGQSNGNDIIRLQYKVQALLEEQSHFGAELEAAKVAFYSYTKEEWLNPNESKANREKRGANAGKVKRLSIAEMKAAIDQGRQQIKAA